MSENYKVGITGAGGYIGSRIAKLLKEEGHDLVLLDNFYNSQIEKIGNIEIHNVDIRRFEEISKHLKDCDVIMHLAGLTSVKGCEDNPVEAFEVNAEGTINIAKICSNNSMPLVYPSTMQTIGQELKDTIRPDSPKKPSNIYGLTNEIGANTIQALAKDSFPAYIFIQSNVYGHHDIGGKKISKGTVINFFVNQALRNEEITVHKPGTQSRDFIHVKDIARAWKKSLNHIKSIENGPSTFTLASGRTLTIIEVAEIVQDTAESLLSYKPEIKLVDNPTEATFTEKFQVDTTDIMRELEFQPDTRIEEAIENMMAASLE